MIQISCGSSIKMHNDTSNDGDAINTIESKKAPYKDTIIFFSCDNLSQSLEAIKINWVYFNQDLAKCLLANGFNGDNLANEQIATIIDHVKYYDLFLLGGSDAEFRGSIIFETFLKKSQDYTPLNLEDEGHGSIYKHGTISDVYVAFYCKMIKSIDGIDPFKFVGKAMKPEELENYLYGEDDLFNPEYGIEVGTKIYDAVSKAWLEGKILLKGFGEK